MSYTDLCHKASVTTHPLYPWWKSVLYNNGSAALKAREVLLDARHRHRARRLVPRVHSVVGVAYRASGLKLKKRVNTLWAKRVKTPERFLLLNSVQANGAVFRTFTNHKRVAVWCVFHYFPVSDDKRLPLGVWLKMAWFVSGQWRQNEEITDVFPLSHIQHNLNPFNLVALKRQFNAAKHPISAKRIEHRDTITQIIVLSLSLLPCCCGNTIIVVNK